MGEGCYSRAEVRAAEERGVAEVYKDSRKGQMAKINSGVKRFAEKNGHRGKLGSGRKEPLSNEVVSAQ